jgi:hypothetical protein
MKRIAIACLLAISSAGVLAGWTKVSDRQDGSSWYIDAATMKKDGSKAEVWLLADEPRASANARSYRSTRFLVEFKCDEAAVQTTRMVYMSEPMGGGIASGRAAQPSPWQAVAPGTIFEDIMHKACGPKQ